MIITTLLLTYMAIGFVVGLYCVMNMIENSNTEDPITPGSCVITVIMFVFIWPVVFTLQSLD